MMKVKKPAADEIEQTSQWGTWSKEPSNFSWYYDEKETCLILDGEVTIKAGNEEVSFKGGDYVIFPEGLDCVWNIKKAVRKYYKFG